MPDYKLTKKSSQWRGEFRAMASPCTVLIDRASRKQAQTLMNMACREAHRIERSYSRYRNDNIVHTINTSNGQPVMVDDETARLLDFAQQCHELSDGLFDITSGLLRKVWTFDGSDSIPEKSAVDALLPHIGWHRVSWQRPSLTLPAGMQIDLGGLGKEYAVDRVVSLLREAGDHPVLVNFGGDLHASKPPAGAYPWMVGIEHHNSNNSNNSGSGSGSGSGSVADIELYRGALATSGDARRFLLKDGVRYSHVLNPLTGWPVVGAPQSVSVAGNSCLEAGMLSTLAMLRGVDAERFLDAESVRYWIQRDPRQSSA